MLNNEYAPNSTRRWGIRRVLHLAGSHGTAVVSCLLLDPPLTAASPRSPRVCSTSWSVSQCSTERERCEYTLVSQIHHSGAWGKGFPFQLVLCGGPDVQQLAALSLCQGDCLPIRFQTLANGLHLLWHVFSRYGIVRYESSSGRRYSSLCPFAPGIMRIFR